MEEKVAEACVEAAKAKREEVQKEIRGISGDYHPFDPETGEPRDAAHVERALNSRFANLEQLAEKMSVSKGRRKLIAKARKNVPLMVATIVYFWHMFFL